GQDTSKWREGTQKQNAEDGTLEMEWSGKKVTPDNIKGYAIVSKTVYEGAPGHEKVAYALSDYFSDRPWTINIYGYKEDQSTLDVIREYDISNADKKDWLTENASRLAKKTFFTGPKDKEKVSYILSGYNEKFVPTEMTVYDYTKDGEDKDSLDETRTYNIENVSEADWRKEDKNRLSNTTVHFGKAGKEKVRYSISDYENGLPGKRTDYSYSEDPQGDSKNLDFVRRFIVSGLSEADRIATGAGIKETETVYLGKEGNEKIYTEFTFDERGNIFERKDYIYEEVYQSTLGSLKAVKTYDTTGLSNEEARERGTGVLKEESLLYGPPGKEKVQQVISYENEKATERKDYNYENGHLISIETYDTSELSAEDARKAGMGKLKEESLFKGPAGNEKIQQTFTYTFDKATGTYTVTERKDYNYKDGRLESVKTYNTSKLSLNDAKTISGTELEAKGLLTEESLFKGPAGNEKIQQTFTYTFDKATGTYTVTERKDYNYKDGSDGEGNRIVGTVTDYYYEDGRMVYAIQQDPSNPDSISTIYYTGREGEEVIDHIDNPLYMGLVGNVDPLRYNIVDPYTFTPDDGRWLGPGHIVFVTHKIGDDSVDDYVYTFYEKNGIRYVDKEAAEDYFDPDSPHNEVDTIEYKLYGADDWRMNAVNFAGGLKNAYTYNAITGALKSVVQTNVSGDVNLTMGYEGGKGSERIITSIDRQGITTRYHYDDTTDGRLDWLEKGDALIEYSGEKGKEKIDYAIDSKKGITSTYVYKDNNNVLDKVVAKTTIGLLLVS
ncbi:MAG: hypothetical protein NTV07_04115, partial [Candidatus Omnitrophica bacterium]|nr:hypothetical protein [Candidatus Omnitrophota bacterium]